MRGDARIPWEQWLRPVDEPGLPLQTRLRQAIVAALADGRLGPGTALPASRILARRLGVARNTVVAVVAQLAEEGLVRVRPRSGVVVAEAFATPGPWAVRDTVIAPSAAASDPPAPPTVDWARRLREAPTARPALAKPAGWQDAPYPFIYGRHDPELFPTDAFRACFTRTLSRSRQPRWTPDLDVDDVPELVEQIRQRLLTRRGILARPEEVLVTVGSQQAFQLIAEALFDGQTRLGLEDPGHPHARTTFGLRVPRLVPLPVDAQGLVVQGVPHLDAVFVTPALQSPTTVTLAPARRVELLARADAHDFLVIEDDYESGAFAPRAPPQPALKSADRSGRVIHVGSLPKDLSPALRLAYVVGAPPLLATMRRLRHAMVRHPSTLLQQAYALFLSLGHLETHERQARLAMAKRLDGVAAALRRHLPGFHFDRPAAGGSIWVRGPAWLDTDVLTEVARTHGVLIEPGSVFFDRPPRPCPYLRLRLSSIRVDRIDDGVRALARAVADVATARVSAATARRGVAA